MARSLEEQELSEHFANEYRRARTPVVLDLERAVCGCDFGGTSWITRDEAQQMGTLLELDEDRYLLEIGGGSGWPALYLAGQSGCQATLTDVPREALSIAAERVVRESLQGKISLAVADGACMPFTAGRFEAIGHSDVLCCLAPKRAVLSECRRVIRRNGIMVFSVISITAGLVGADYVRAVDAGPPFVEAECGYPQLLEETGWRLTDRIDLTATYEQTLRRYIREAEARADGMRALLGETELGELLAKRRKNVQAVADGIVRRDLFVTMPCEVRRK